MANLIQLKENKDAIDISASFESEAERKEIYIKYLIVNALNNQSFYVNIANSMFYSSRFYSATKLFDFYVNNNLFDLIVLKPDSSEMIFEVNRDEIHANIYGYVVARLGVDAKSTEILGYFNATDFDSVVMGHSVATAKLTPIENFANIEIADNQLSLDDVSDRFFELLSMFMDNDISKNNLSELACLLYNSAELRHAFSQVGMFDKICADIGTHPDIVEQHFGSAQAPFVENIEELPNLASIDNVMEAAEIAVDEPVVESETTLEPDLITAEEQPETENIAQDVLSEPEVIKEEEKTEEFIFEPVEDAAVTEQIAAIPTEEQVESKEPEETKISDSLDEFIIDTTALNESELDEIDNLSLSEEPLPEELDEFNVETTNTTETQIEEIDIDKLAEEQLSDIPEQPKETYDNKWENLSLVTDDKTPKTEEESTVQTQNADTPKIEANEELMDILDEVEDDVNIDDNEVMSMLNDKVKTQSAQTAKPVQPQPSIVNRSVTEELQSPAKTELTVLYKPNTQRNDEFATDNMATTTRNIGQPIPKKSKKKLVAVAAAAIILLGVTSIATNFIIGGNSKVEEVANTQNEIEEDYQFPIEGDTEATNTSMPAPAPVTNDYVPNLSSGSDTKIVSSTVTQHRGAAPVILKSVAWQVPASITNDTVFNKYLQIAGKNIKVNLASDLLDADDFAYNNKIKISMTVRNNTAVKNIKVIESSGSKNIDDLVLQSIKLTLKYINTPVMTADTGDKDIILVISI